MQRQTTNLLLSPCELQKVHKEVSVLFLIYIQSQMYAWAKAGTENIFVQSTEQEPLVDVIP